MILQFGNILINPMTRDRSKRLKAKYPGLKSFNPARLVHIHPSCMSDTYGLNIDNEQCFAMRVMFNSTNYNEVK